jgi:hypothetical protein
MTMRHIYERIAGELHELGRAIIPDDVIRIAQVRYPEEYGADTERLALGARRRDIAKILKKLQPEDGESPQLSLPGVALPSYLTVPTEGGFAYHPTWSAGPDELRGHIKVMRDNVAAVTQELRVAEEQAKDILPVLDANPGMTIAEAVRRL